MFGVWFERYAKRKNQTIAKIKKVQKLRQQLNGE